MNSRVPKPREDNKLNGPIFWRNDSDGQKKELMTSTG
jgi:hypothetical protein